MHNFFLFFSVYNIYDKNLSFWLRKLIIMLLESICKKIPCYLVFLERINFQYSFSFLSYSWLLQITNFSCLTLSLPYTRSAGGMMYQPWRNIVDEILSWLGVFWGCLIQIRCLTPLFPKNLLSLGLKKLNCSKRHDWLTIRFWFLLFKLDWGWFWDSVCICHYKFETINYFWPIHAKIT